MHPNLTHLYEGTPVWLDTSFAAITVLTIGILYTAFRRVSMLIATRLLMISIIWMTILALLAYNHFFQQLDATPPRFGLVIGPPLLFMGGLLLSAKGRFQTSQLPLSVLMLLHTVRIPVELTLYGLYLDQQIPQLMTFEGRNFDIVAGITAPIIAYFVFQRRQVSARWLLFWNVLALGLLVNIVAHAVLSAPLPFQQLAFEQPNVGVLKAPYVWLPGVIVPAVLFSHIISIQRLVNDVFRHQSARESNQTTLPR